VSEVIGRVVALNRYPVKSMQGQQPDEVSFDATGMTGDRRWAVRAAGDDAAKVLSAKRERSLLEAAATNDGTDAGPPTITLPDGRVLEPGDPDTDSILSDWLGRRVELVEVGQAPSAYEMSFNVDDEDDAVFDVPMPADRFVDLCPIHVLTTASIATMAAAYPEGDWNPNRFRPGVLIETDPAITGLPENDWMEADGVTIGAIVVKPVMPTIRCVMTTRAQPAHGLDRDLTIVKTVNATNSANLGLYGAIATPGVVRIGDPVTVA
jgi:uncharacterized protein YcbX